jgi:hypothetical protein
MKRRRGGAAAHGSSGAALPPEAAGVADTSVRPPPVSTELERRAGSFMRPPLAPWQPAKPIPKAKLPPPPRRQSRKIAEGD